VKAERAVCGGMDYRIRGKRKDEFSFLGPFPENQALPTRGNRREGGRACRSREAKIRCSLRPTRRPAPRWQSPGHGDYRTAVDNVSQDYLKLREREGSARQTASRLRTWSGKVGTRPLCGKAYQDIGGPQMCARFLEREIAADRIATANGVRRSSGKVMTTRKVGG